MSSHADKPATTAASPVAKTKIEPPTTVTAASPITSTQGKSSTATYTNRENVNDTSAPGGGTSFDGDKINAAGADSNTDISNTKGLDPSSQLVDLERAFTEAQVLLDRLKGHENKFLSIHALIFALKIKRLITMVENRAEVDKPWPMFPGRKFHNRILGHCELALHYSNLLIKQIPRLKALRYDDFEKAESLLTSDQLEEYRKYFGLLLNEMRTAAVLFVDYRKAIIGFEKSKRRALAHDLAGIEQETCLWVMDATKAAARMGIPR